MATAAPVSRLDEIAHALHYTKIVKDRTRVVHGRCYHDSCARGCRAQGEGGVRLGTAETAQSLHPCRLSPPVDGRKAPRARLPCFRGCGRLDGRNQPRSGGVMSNEPKKINRRAFLNQGATLAAGATVLGSTALSYSRIVGANDRISLGHIGIGNRGTELDWIAGRLKDKHNVEMTAVCDLWTINREKAAARNEKYYGRAPRQFKYLEDLLALKDVDAVLISTPEHSHSPVLKLVAEAGKDAYVEKPMGNVLEEAKAARDAVLERNLIVQVGTQHRSELYPRAAHDVVQSGAHGDVYAWHDGRENPDTFHALLEYPKGFLASYSTSFGNDADSFTRYMGKKATLIDIGGEGSPRYKLVEEKGNHEDNPNIDKQRPEKYITLPGDNGLPPTGI